MRGRQGLCISHLPHMHGRHFDSPNQNQDIFSIRAPIRRDKEAPINRYNYNFSTRAPLRPVQLCNGAASVGLNPHRKGNFVSIRTPVWGVAENFTNRIVPAEISIHAPRAGSDMSKSDEVRISPNFNPRSPCGERRALRSFAWSASNFNPRSPCGERLVLW